MIRKNETGGVSRWEGVGVHEQPEQFTELVHVHFSSCSVHLIFAVTVRKHDYVWSVLLSIGVMLMDVVGRYNVVGGARMGNAFLLSFSETVKC